MINILLLEDDISLNETICEFLEDNGYKVIPTYDGEEAQDQIYENRVDILLLDVNVPNINGFELLKQEREKGSLVPAIFITSMDSVDDVEQGFKSGGNDYIRKPFSLKELLLRIENLIKLKPKEPIKINDDINFNQETNSLNLKNESIKLQYKESLLLELFLKNIDKIVHHQTIMDTLWDYSEAPSEQAVRTYIKNLRKYLGKKSIVSYKKLGYKFTI